MSIFRYALALSALFFLAGCNGQQESNKPQNNIVKVDVLEVTGVKFQPSAELPGRVAAIRESEVRPQVSGIIQKRLFTEGKEVKAGDVLYQIDPSIYQANVNNTQSNLDKAKADQNVAKKKLDRYTELNKKKLISQQDYDDAEANYEQATAEVNVAQSNLDYNNILLSYTEVKAPISGRIGISTVSEGALVTAEQTSYLTTIKQYDSVYVDMTQSSLELQRIRKNVTGTQAPKNDKHPEVRIKLEDGSLYSLSGYLESSDITVDQSTSSVTIRAIVPNPDKELLPGIFVRATIMGPILSDVILLPQSVIIRSQKGDPYVYIVDENNQAVKKDLVLGQEVDNQWVILEGLKAGDKVILNNVMKLKNGVEVSIDNSYVSQKPDVLTEKNTSNQ
ncbi:efflux RND transporter periplasmic adaptor subunit [Vibrio sp. E150_018]